ncbi:helix-turn-helix domain-containing protein [Nitrospirillum viridazoti]|uniref:helix-turn-helix domain-containing protein n=1 Tax=Nitrospirillum viridazoti TaxID=3144925 RepID=UPI0034E2CF29
MLVQQRKSVPGLTQEEVAARLNTKQTVISKWETGEVRLNVVDFARYCRVVGLDPGEMLAGVGHY